MAERGHKKQDSRWSGNVTRHSNALDLENSVLTFDSPHRIAQSLKRSAEARQRRKAPACRSAMSMLTSCINRGGANLPAEQRAVLEQAKSGLRKAFGRA